MAPPNAPPQTPQYLTILLTERGAGITFCRILAPPPPSPTPQYLTILMTERGGGIIFCRILAPPSPDATILMLFMLAKTLVVFYVWSPDIFVLIVIITLFQALFILLCQIKHYHTIPLTIL